MASANRERLCQDDDHLRRELEALRAENEQLRRQNAELQSRLDQAERRINELERENTRLRDQLERNQRENKRQAAPFSKGKPKRQPRKPGRKPGKQYGRHARRSVPNREPDEDLEVPLPDQCPSCGGTLKAQKTAYQHQMEIPRRPVYRRFRIHIGRCTCCGRRHQPRHALQTSDAIGAASSQLGPYAQAAMAELNKTLGLSFGKVQHVFQSLFGLEVSRSGCAQAVMRAGERCEPVYEQIVQAMPQQSVVSADETGWRIGGMPAWLHALTAANLTCYAIDSSRGFEVPAAILGGDFDGTLIHDGWAPYDRFTEATHQTCLQHLLERCRQMIDVAVGGAVHFPREVYELLHRALILRDRKAADQLSEHGFVVARGQLEAKTDRLLSSKRTNPANRRLSEHLHRHRDQLFTFLYQPDVAATNYRAEQTIRPAVANRKVWGGNRTDRGARAQMVLMSVLRTAEQQGRDVLTLLSHILRGDLPQLAPRPSP